MASSRMTIMGTRHVISAGHYLAAHAGFQVLEAGGNAVAAGRGAPLDWVRWAGVTVKLA